MLGEQINEKDYHKKFKEVGSQLEIKSNIKKVEFLDVTFNLITGLYTPYQKLNDNLLYINTSSDHPLKIIKQLTNSINTRLCENSANEQVFNIVKPVYENALHKSGYKRSLKCSEKIHQYNSKKRTRNIIWFNPRFLKPLKLTLQSHSSNYWINIFQSLNHYTISLAETPSKLVIVA